MSHTVIVVFGKDKEFEFRFTQADLGGRSAEEARRWFDKEFVSLECEPSNPVGKVLIIDKVLNVAKYGGQARFADASGWAQDFARNAALALGRDTIRVDVVDFVIGY